MKREWSEDMGEISGFGGSYEAGCRAAVLAGIDWIDEHPECVLRLSGYEGVYGLVNEETKDTKKLWEAMAAAKVTMDDGKESTVGAEATGAIHHATMMHCLAYKELGWEEYCRQMREREPDEEAG